LAAVEYWGSVLSAGAHKYRGEKIYANWARADKEVMLAAVTQDATAVRLAHDDLLLDLANNETHLKRAFLMEAAAGRGDAGMEIVEHAEAEARKRAEAIDDYYVDYFSSGQIAADFEELRNDPDFVSAVYPPAVLVRLSFSDETEADEIVAKMALSGEVIRGPLALEPTAQSEALKEAIAEAIQRRPFQIKLLNDRCEEMPETLSVREFLSQHACQTRIS